MALAEPLVAADAHPRFDNSSVDGYAVPGPVDSGGGLSLSSKAVPAGGVASDLIVGECCRVLTGAPIPANCFGVAMQEDVDVVESNVSFTAGVVKDQNIRRRGADLMEGDELASVGSPVNSGVVALGASQGYRTLAVFSRPRVGLVTTGDELVDPAETPKGSQLRDSSQSMLVAQLHGAGVELVECHRIADDFSLLRQTLVALSERCDLIVTAGGASVGDHDCIPGAVRKHGFIYLRNVGIQPGKPTLFGRIGETPILALPGNPASSFVCFELFGVEMIRIMAGFSHPSRRWLPAVYEGDHEPNGRQVFERARLLAEGGALHATPLPVQESFGIRSLAGADALARLPANVPIGRGDRCDVLPLW